MVLLSTLNYHTMHPSIQLCFVCANCVSLSLRPILSDSSRATRASLEQQLYTELSFAFVWFTKEYVCSMIDLRHNFRLVVVVMMMVNGALRHSLRSSC